MPAAVLNGAPWRRRRQRRQRRRRPSARGARRLRGVAHGRSLGAELHGHALGTAAPVLPFAAGGGARAACGDRLARGIRNRARAAGAVAREVGNAAVCRARGGALKGAAMGGALRAVVVECGARGIGGLEGRPRRGWGGGRCWATESRRRVIIAAHRAGILAAIVLDRHLLRTGEADGGKGHAADALGRRVRKEERDDGPPHAGRAGRLGHRPVCGSSTVSILVAEAQLAGRRERLGDERQRRCLQQATGNCSWSLQGGSDQ